MSSNGLLHTVIRGKLDAATTIVFLHGWPDTDALFAKQYAAFEGTHRIVTAILPNYTKEARFDGSVGYLGFSLDTVTDLFIATVKSVSENGPPLLVAHDWGAVFAYLALAKEPRLVSKLVALDIGQHSSPSLKGMLFLVWYQWSLIFFYFLPSFLGTPLTKLMAKIFKAPNLSTVHSGMNYLYVQTWKLLLTNNAGALRRWNPPTVPVLYLYGTRKPVFFHSPRWLAHVNGQPESTGGKAVSFSGGHWFFVGRHSDAVNKEIQQFFQK